MKHAFLSLFILSGFSFAQTCEVSPADNGFDQWFKCRPEILNSSKRAALTANASKLVAAGDAGSVVAASSAPSIDPASSAVVDRSNPGEFFNAAVNLASLNGQPSASTPTGSVTVTAYSLIAALQGQSLVDPDLYKRGRYLRRAAFTIGTAASDLIKDGTETPGALYGARWRILEGPDLFGPYRDPKTGKVVKDAQQKTTPVRETILQNLQTRLNSANSHSELFTLMFPLATQKFPAAGANPTKEQYEEVYNSASDAEKKAIDELLTKAAEEDDDLTRSVLELREQLKRPRQLTFAYFTTQRTDGGADDHRLELILDWGLHKRIDWTTNGGFEYRNVMIPGGDRKGGRVASEAKILLFQVSDPADTAERWMSLDLAGEWKASTGIKPYFKFQARLTIPTPGGLNLPLAWSYESRPWDAGAGQINDSFKRFRFGIEFDPAKIGLGK